MCSLADGVNWTETRIHVYGLFKEVDKLIDRIADWRNRAFDKDRDLYMTLVNAGIISTLCAWAATRYNYSLYKQLYAKLENLPDCDLKSTLEDMLWLDAWHFSPRVNNGAEVGSGGNVWFFGFDSAQCLTAGTAFEKARKMADLACKTIVNTERWAFPFIKGYFLRNHPASNSDEPSVIYGALQQLGVRTKIRDIVHELQRNPCSIVLSKEERPAKVGREGVAYCTGVGKKDTDRGSVIHLYPCFFTDIKAHGDLGTTIPLYEDYLRGSTVLHEATHLFASTRDVETATPNGCYGFRNCGGMGTKLGKLNAEQQAVNADSYACFAYHLYANTKFQAAHGVSGAKEVLREIGKKT